jgi:uncharacterized membrane protein YgcG
MLNRILKLFGTPFVALVFMIGFSTASFAAGPTWLPKGNQFKPGQHVYLDPKLESGGNPVNLDGLEAQLKTEGAKQGVEFFYVMVLKGDEAKNPKVPFAVERLDDLIGNWSGQKGFPTSKAVTILVVRLDSDWTKSSYAINTAPALAPLGVTSVNMTPTLDQYGKNPNGGNPNALLPRAPADFGIKVAQATNARLVQYQADLKQAEANRLAQIERQKQEAIAAAERQKQEAIQAEADRRAHEKFMAELPMNLAMYGTPSVIVIVLLVLILLFASNKKLAVRALEDWKKQFEPGNQNYLELEKAYWGFLKNQGDQWSSRFKDETLARFKVAVQAYADLSVRINAALTLMSDSEKDIKSASIFSIGKLKGAAARLTVTPIKITGETLPIEQRSMFGSIVAEATYAPDELLDNIAQLFDTANKDCATIKNAMGGAQQNKEDIEGLLASVAATRSELTEKGLNFAPYEIRFTQLTTARDEFLALMIANPLQAFEKSEAVEQGVEALKVTLNRAISLKVSLASTTKLIDAAQAKIAAARSKPADFDYPEKPATLEKFTGGNFNLSEEGANPDTQMAEAKDHLQACLDNLLAGKLDLANIEKATAEKSAAEASTLVDTIFAALAFLKQQVPVVRGALNKLGEELPASKEDVAALNAGFLTKNFEGEPKKLDTGNSVFQKTDAELAKIRKAFFEQRYMAARAALEKTGSDIQSARNGLVEIHTRLGQLIENRQHAKAIVQEATQFTGALSVKLSTNQFTTSATTDGTYAQLKPVLLGQQQNVAKEITDWPEAAVAADKLLSDLKAVDKAIDNEKAAHELALSRIATLSGAMQSAKTTLAMRTTRQPARTKLEGAIAAQARVETSVTVAKSDWNAIVRAAEAAKVLVDDAVKLAQEDARAAAEAAEAISDAESYIDGVDSKSYSESRSIGHSSQSFGYGVSADVSSARSRLNQAKQQLQATEYEAAKASAISARQAAKDADEQAEAEVTTAIAAAVAVWEQAERERRRREQEEQDRRDRERREQQQRDDDARAAASRNNDSGFGGGGGSSGSEFSGGGGSNGGGDF